MIHKVSLHRKWRGPVPRGRDGQPIPRELWPKRRASCYLVRWFASTADGKIKRPSRRFPTRDEAEAFRTKLQSQFDVAPQTRREPRKVTLGEFVAEYLALGIGPRGQRLKPRSLQQARLALNHFAKVIGEDRPLANITPPDVARYLASLRQQPKGGGAATINFRQRMLRAAFAVAISPLELLKENPLRGFKATRVTETPIRYVSADEFRAILDATETTSRPFWWRAFLSVCYCGGLRFSEALHLTWRDIDFAAETIAVSAKSKTESTVAWEPKDYEHRVIPIPASALAMLTKLQASAPDNHAYVFISPERIAFIKASEAAGEWSPCRPLLNNMHRVFPELVRRAGEAMPSLVDRDGNPTVTIHDMRRSAITNWTKAANVQTVAKLAGHADIATTMTFYAAVTTDQLDAVRAANAAAMAAVFRRSDPSVTLLGPLAASRDEDESR